jgi:hypothetical protein
MDLTKHNYYSKLLALYQRGGIPAASLTEVDIFHDDWCAVYKGGYCNCDPDVRLRPEPAANGGDDRRSPEVEGDSQGSLYEDTRPLEPPTTPCPHCGAKDFILWQGANDSKKWAISCNGCGAVMSSTHPLDSDNRPMRRP